MERDDRFNCFGSHFCNFNSHAHVERDVLEFADALEISNFNSHAHVERDCIIFWTYKDLVISTHTLTWSVTLGYYMLYYRYSISTHTLTWSVT